MLSEERGPLRSCRRCPWSCTPARPSRLQSHLTRSYGHPGLRPKPGAGGWSASPKAGVLQCHLELSRKANSGPSQDLLNEKVWAEPGSLFPPRAGDSNGPQVGEPLPKGTGL